MIKPAGENAVTEEALIQVCMENNSFSGLKQLVWKYVKLFLLV